MINLFSKKSKEPKEKENDILKPQVTETSVQKIDKIKELSIIMNYKDKISDLIDDFFDRSKFIDNSRDYAKLELRDTMYSRLDHDFIYFHIYGDVPSFDNNVSKVDFVKDCRAFQVTVTDVIDLRNSVRFLRHYIHRFEAFLCEITENYKIYSKHLNFFQDKVNENIIDRIGMILESYMTEVMYTLNVSSDLICILNRYYDKNLNRIDNKIKLVKYDTLKRYYFNDTYTLKNSVKMFNKEAMVFGEINNIMKQYNYIYNFVFGTMVCDIQSIKTIFESINEKI